MYEFDLIRASSLGEAVAAAAQNGDAKYLGGGQTLLPTMKQRLASPSHLIALSGIADLRGLQHRDGALTIGGGTTHASVAGDAHADFPALARLAGQIGDPSVRNRGTIGGSLANNDPAACYPAAVLACAATIVTDRREIAAADYFQGTFTTALAADEIITAVRFPLPLAADYQKFIQPASRFSIVGVFVARYADRVGVAVTGAAAEGVFRWHEAEEALTARFDLAALRLLTVNPDAMMADSFGSRGYRAHLVPVLTERAVLAMNWATARL